MKIDLPPRLTLDTESLNPCAATGAFQLQFSFAMPEGAPQGVKPFKTALYLNGQKVRYAQPQLQVVFIGPGIVAAPKQPLTSTFAYMGIWKPNPT